MATTQETTSNSGISQQFYLVVGIVASACALLFNPVLDIAISSLVFLNKNITFIVPGVFGLIALASGIQLYRRQETRQGIGLIIASFLTALTAPSTDSA